VWSRTWQLVGRAAQVAAPGEFRDRRGRRRAGGRGARGPTACCAGSSTSCPPHHAAAVMTAPCGKVDRACAARTTAGPTTSRASCAASRSSTGVRDFRIARRWGSPRSRSTPGRGLVFVHLDRDPVPLAAHLGEPGRPDRAARARRARVLRAPRVHAGRATGRCSSTTTSTAATHVPHLHPSAELDPDLQPTTRSRTSSGSLPAGQPDRGRRRSGDRGGSARAARLYYWIYPNLMLNWYAGHLDTNLVLPLGVESHEGRVRVPLRAGRPGTRRGRRPTSRASRSPSGSSHEDVTICESVQRGLRFARLPRRAAVGAPRGPASTCFHRLLARDLRGG